MPGCKSYGLLSGYNMCYLKDSTNTLGYYCSGCMSGVYKSLVPCPFTQYSNTAIVGSEWKFTWICRASCDMFATQAVRSHIITRVHCSAWPGVLAVQPLSLHCIDSMLMMIMIMFSSSRQNRSRSSMRTPPLQIGTDRVRLCVLACICS